MICIILSLVRFKWSIEDKKIFVKTRNFWRRRSMIAVYGECVCMHYRQIKTIILQNLHNYIFDLLATDRF